MIQISHTVKNAKNSVEAIEVARKELEPNYGDLGCVLSVLSEGSPAVWTLSFEK